MGFQRAGYSCNTSADYDRQAKRGLAVGYGGSIVVDGVACTAFPAARDLAAAESSELAATVRSERKAQRLLAIARAFSTADPTFLATAPTIQLGEWWCREFG